MATEKAFLTYEEQVQKLLERGLGIFDVNEAIEILSSENYYRLINPLPEHTRLGIPKTGQEHDQGIHDVFAILLVVKSLLNNPTELYEMKVEINNALYKLQKSLMSISIDQVLFKMGFPDNWQSI
ncbi:MAG TPA: hypothetical protein DIW48_09455 [Sphaerochaeta sp.]|nr:MAG: hypothetical protein A2Y31_05695 [Spirochaetes bacterium GWC2_52_13]HCS36889.1 hypothetical protein [Sphaerochaeta sp.]